MTRNTDLDPRHAFDSTQGRKSTKGAMSKGMVWRDASTESVGQIRHMTVVGMSFIDNGDGTGILGPGGDPGESGELEGSVSAIIWVIDGGGAVIPTGLKGAGIRIPFACSITGWTVLLEPSGSIVIDIWKDSYANNPPTDADSITGGNEPEVSGDTEATGGVTGWTTAVAAGDTIRFNVDSVATATHATIILEIERAASGGGGGGPHSHAGSDISSGTIADARIDAAIARDSEVTSAVSAHTGDTSAAHAASAVSFTPNGSIAATDVQAAIQEVRDEAAGGGVTEITDLPTAETDTSLRLAPDGAGGVEWAASAGGGSFVGCAAYKNAGQTLGGASETTLLFDTDEYDTDGIHDTGSNTGRLTVPSGKDGFWRFTWILPFIGNSGVSYSYIRIDGTTAVPGSEYDSSEAADSTHSGSVTLDLNAAQYVEIRAFRVNGGDIGSSAAQRARFEAHYLGA